MRASRRLGVLGGTFDPIHVGHLDAADAVWSAMKLDEMRFVPSHDPAHRPLVPRATPFHRFALVSLAVDERQGYRACDVELLREGPSYTSDTLRALRTEGWSPSQIFFVLGADAFAEIATWREFPDVLDAAHFAVIARPGTTLDVALARTPSLRARVRHGPEESAPDAHTAVFLVTASTRDVSSTAIRARLASRQPIAGLVPPAVERHILAHHLYRSADDLHGKE